MLISTYLMALTMLLINKLSPLDAGFGYSEPINI